MKGSKLKAKSYTSALSVFENFVSIKRTQPHKIKNLNCLSSLLVVLAVIFADFYVQRLKNYELSQTWTQKYTKKTVKSTSKVHPNYEEWGQKKLEKLKFLLNLYVLFVWTFFFSTNIPEIITYYYGWKQPISDFPLLTLSWFFFQPYPYWYLPAHTVQGSTWHYTGRWRRRTPWTWMPRTHFVMLSRLG